MSFPQELRRAEAYPGFASKGVELVETHLSWVFLLDRDVFKLKKPVNLGFVDFRSLASRRKACEAEVELNHRLAGDVYLGVLPVVRDEHGTRVGGSGTIVDWVVHMRRLRDACRADHMLEAQRLSGPVVDALAARLAEFHTLARSDAETAAFGTVETIRTNVFENFAQADAAIRAVISEPEMEEIEVFQSWFLTEHRARFEDRVKSGRVRDCHGDLRLEHVYFEQPERATIIDCIEFNERFRFSDVCADVAFVSMDLSVRGRPDLAERFLARYASASNDFDLYGLVDFYESYRAFVRGKVALILAADQDASADLRERAKKDARRHFLCALAASRPAFTRPFVLAIGGLVGTGKSTLAESVSAAHGIPLISSDRTRKWLSGVTAEHSLRSAPFQGTYASAQSEKTYYEMFRRAAVVVESGRSVILDASFREARHRDAARALARESGLPFLFVECRCAEEVALARMGARAARPCVSDAGPELAAVFAQRFEAVTELPKGEHVVVSTEQPVERVRQLLQERLGLEPVCRQTG